MEVAQISILELFFISDSIKMKGFDSPGIAGGYTRDRDILTLLLEQKNQLEKMGQQIGGLINASKIGSHVGERHFVSTNCIQNSGLGMNKVAGTAGTQEQNSRGELTDHDHSYSEPNEFEARIARRMSNVHNDSLQTHGYDFEEIARELPEVEEKFMVFNERTHERSYVSTDSFPGHGYVSKQVTGKIEEEELPEVERQFRVHKRFDDRSFYVSIGSEVERGYVSEEDSRVTEENQEPPEVDKKYNGREKPDDSEDIRELSIGEEIWDNESSNLKVGLRFQTRDSVKKFLKLYGERTNTKMVVSEGGLSSGCKSKKIVVKCSYGQGKDSVAREDGRPNQHTKKLGCSAFIRFFVRGNKNERKLCVIKGFSESHNHMRTREMFYQDTQKVTEKEELSFVAESTKLHVKPAQLRKCMQEKFQKPGLSIDHVRYVMKKVSGPDQSREQLSDLLKKIEDDGGTVEILRQKGSDKVRVLTVQTKEMKRAFLGANPTVVLFDTTFGFCDEGYKMSGFCYSNNLTGHGELGQLVFLADEGAESLNFAFQSFRRSVLNDPKFFMIDKDFTEIQTIKKVFVNSSILLCQFHVMKYIKTLLSTSRASAGSYEKVDIEKKDTIMTSFRAVVYAKTELEAKDCSEKFLAESETIDVRVGNGDKAYYTNLREYYIKNWESCSDLWMSWRRVNIPGLEDNTNNRLERMWRSLKEFLKNSTSGSASISRAVIVLLKFAESQLVDRYTWHQRHIMRIACDNSKFEEELKRASTYLNDGGMLKLKKSLDLLGNKRSNMKVTDEGVVEEFSQRKEIDLETECDEVQFNIEVNLKEQRVARSLVTARFVSDENVDIMSNCAFAPPMKRTKNIIGPVKKRKKNNSGLLGQKDNGKHTTASDVVSYPMMTAGYVSDGILTSDCVSEPVLTAVFFSDAILTADSVSDPTTRAGYVCDAILADDYVSDPMMTADYVSESLITPGYVSQPMMTAGYVSQPMMTVRDISGSLGNANYVSEPKETASYVSEECLELPEEMVDDVSSHSKSLEEFNENGIEGNKEKKDDEVQISKTHTAVEKVARANEKIYKTNEKNCNCSWHIKTCAPCRHILLVRENRSLSLFDKCLFHTRYLKERAFDLHNDMLSIEASNESEGGDKNENGNPSVVEDPLDVHQKAMSKGDRYRLFGPICERLLDAAMRNGTPKAHLYEKELEVLINRAKKGESLLLDSKTKGRAADAVELITINEEQVLDVKHNTENDKFNLLWHDRTKVNKVGRPKESKVKFNKKNSEVNKKQKKIQQESNGSNLGKIVCSFPYDKDHPEKNALYETDLESLKPRIFITDVVVDFFFRYSQPNGPLGQAVFLINTSSAQQLESWHWSKIPSLKDLVPSAGLYDNDGCRIVFMAWCEWSHYFGIVAVCDETPTIYVLESIGRYPEPRGAAILSSFIQQIRDSKKLPQVTIPTRTLDVPRQSSGSNNCGIFLMKNATAVLESPEEFLQKAPRNELANWYQSESVANGRADIIAMINGLQKAQSKTVPNFEKMFGVKKSLKVRHEE